MAEKAIRLGGESTAAAITQAVQELYPEHKFTEAEFARKDNAAEIAVDTNFAAQSFWKDVRIRFFRKKSAVLGLVMIAAVSLSCCGSPRMKLIRRFATSRAFFGGCPIPRLVKRYPSKVDRRHINGKRIAMVFQDPMTSLASPP